MVNDLDTYIDQSSEFADFVSSNPDSLYDHALGWRGQRSTDKALGRFSPGNSSAKQLEYARNKQDYKAILQASIEEEQTIAMYERQLADQERLTAEQREYESPAAQIQRQRAAGFNPDLQGSSGGSSFGGSSGQATVPSMQDTSMSMELSNPYATADRVFAGISSVSSLLSSVSGFATQAFDLVKGVATFGDFLSLSDSGRRISAANADLAEGLVGPQLQQASESAASARMSGISQLAGTLDLTQEYSDEQLREVIANAGHKDEDGSYLADLKRFISNPENRARSYSALADYNEAYGRSVANTFEFYKKLYESENRLKLISTDLNYMRTRFERSVQAVVSSDPYAVNDASQAILGELSADRWEQSTAASRAYNDFMAYSSRVSAVEYFYNELVKDIDDFKSSDASKTPEGRVQLISKYLAASRLYTIGSDELSNMYSLLDVLKHQSYVHGTYWDENGDFNSSATFIQDLPGKDIWRNAMFGEFNAQRSHFMQDAVQTVDIFKKVLELRNMKGGKGARRVRTR